MGEGSAWRSGGVGLGVEPRNGRYLVTSSVNPFGKGKKDLNGAFGEPQGGLGGVSVEALQRSLNGAPEERQRSPRGAPRESQEGRSRRGGLEELQCNGGPEEPQWRLRGAPMETQSQRGLNGAPEEPQWSLRGASMEPRRGPIGLRGAPVEPQWGLSGEGL